VYEKEGTGRNKQIEMLPVSKLIPYKSYRKIGKLRGKQMRKQILTKNMLKASKNTKRLGYVK
jgi:hypothetical protein